MDKFFSEVQARPYSLKNVPLESLHKIWNGLCSTLLATISSGKGMSVANFGTWSFHVDPVDLGTQKRVLKTPVFTLSEKFARQYNVRCPRQPSGISGMIPVRDLNVMTIASACGQPRDLVNTALKDIFLYAGEVALSGAPLKLDFHGIGTFQCSGGTCKFVFSSAFATTFQENLRPGSSNGVHPPTPSILARIRPGSSGAAAAQTWGGHAHGGGGGDHHDHGPPASGPGPAASASGGGGYGAGKAPTPRLSTAASGAAGPATSLHGHGRGAAAQQDASAPPSRRGGVEGWGQSRAAPSDGRRSGRAADSDKDQVVVIREPGIDVSRVDISVRGLELVVRQRDIDFERVIPLHGRVDMERISARFRNGALEITIPDKAAALRAFYERQIQERDGMRKVEEEEDAMLLRHNRDKNALAAELEQQALAARRRARADVEAFNRRQLAQGQKRDQFPMPDKFGYLLYKRPDKADEPLIPPARLRSILDAQVQMKQEAETKQREAERALVDGQLQELRKELEEDERRALEEKRRRQRERTKELGQQVERQGPRLPGAHSSICDFPRIDNDLLAQTQKREELKRVQDQVVAQVHHRGQQTLEEKRQQYQQDMQDLHDAQRMMDEEDALKMAALQHQKQQNRLTWKAQIRTKREAVGRELLHPVRYATSLPVGEVETSLVRSILPQPTPA